MKKTLAIFAAACLLIGLARTQTPNYGTNLWMQISSVTNGRVSLILHNTVYTQTGEVYEVWSKTNRAIPGWNIETDVWAVANQNWTPCTVLMLGRTNLFIGARDWTGIDENSNGIPDWWEYEHPGVLPLVPTQQTTNAPPVITSQPTNQTVLQGSNATFSVTVSGTGPFTYQWQLNGTNLASIITTVAGGGNDLGNDGIGDGTNATNASLCQPWGVAVDDSGNLFIVDECNQRIRKVDTNGIITTVAGGGKDPGNDGIGDGTNATSASLRAPYGVAVDASSNLFIADTYNDVIRKVDTNGIITTVAGFYQTNCDPEYGCYPVGGYSGDGTNATNASLSEPWGVAVDASGNLFIADTGNYVIRKVDTNGIITTVAGGGGGEGDAATDAILSYPCGVAVDASGNLFIADANNGLIRKVDTNGIITTLAGGGDGEGDAATNASLSYPCGVAVDASGNLFIVDEGTALISKVDTSGIITTVAGGGDGEGDAATNASLYWPMGVAVDAFGNLFIADTGNDVIREVASTWSPTLTLNNVTANDAGNYTVIITSLYGSVTSSNAVLTVNVPPTITIQPTNQTVVQGSNATFTVTAAGTTPSYQWYFNETNVIGATNSSLTLTNVQTTNAGSYYVVVANVAGSVTSSNAVLKALVPPLITTQPTNQTVIEGGDATFTVTAASTTPSYQWYFGSGVLTNATSATLILTNVSPWDAGIYTVTVSNAVGSVTSSYVALRVFAPSSVVTWGDDPFGVDDTSVPASLINVVAIAAKYDHSLALKSDGTVVAWGSDSFGQSDVPAGLTNVVAIAVGDYHDLALLGNGTVVAWGNGDYGQTNVPARLTNAVAISAEGLHSLALKDDGTVVAWGSDNFGQGNVPRGLTNVVAIAAGWYHSLALKSGGTVVGWGDNTFSEITVPASLTNVTAISAGGINSLALKSDGTVAAWGDNECGQNDVPSGLTNVVAIAAGGWYYSLALLGNGTVVAWGDDSYGESDVPAGLTNVVAVATGEFFSLALINLVVSGQANIFGSGHAVAPDPGGGGGGVLPPMVALPDGIGRIVTFPSVTGFVGWSDDQSRSNGPDGDSYGPTGISSYDGISGIQSDNLFFLVGVFLTDAEPADPAPPSLNFAGAENFTNLSPMIGQVFFIGDGLTGTGSGTLQTFQIPDNATRMYLGFADAWNFSSSPGQYDDDWGSLDVIYSFSYTGDALQITPATGFSAVGCVGGPFTVTNETFSLRNVGTAPLNWSLADTLLWLGASSGGGTLMAGGTANVTVSLNSNACSLTSRIYTATVWFTNLSDSVGQSRQFTLAVGSPPLITQQPTNQIVIQGSNVTFSVTVSGAGPFTYQWQLNGTNLDGIITTVAGNYNNGESYGGDGTNATDASLFEPYGVAVDASGNLFIADTDNNVIRKVDTNGIITTVAGNYSNYINGIYYGGDGTNATDASLFEPSGVAVDAVGNLFIADLQNCVIRKVDTNGIITTVAGNYNNGESYGGDGTNATNAGLWNPSGVAVDASGNLFIADTGNNVIRKVDTNGIITTVTGNYNNGGSYGGDGTNATNAGLNGPDGVAVDTSGNLFIADTGNNVIRKVDTNGIITTVAGGGNDGLGDGTNATNASLNWPFGVVVDASGNLFIADTDNSVIRKVDTNGIITTVAGNYNAGRSYDGDGGAATNASLYWPRGVVVDASGNLFIADTDNNVIWEVFSVNCPTLTLNNVIANDAGNYTVIIANPYGSVTSAPPATLTVLVPPVITQQPTDLIVIQGSNATFTVAATNTMPLSYQWYFNETNVIGATNSSLTLTNVQTNNDGSYYVVVAMVTNVAASVTSSNAVLTVLVPPLITTQPTNQTVIEGGNATFTVIATGTIPLSYQWYFNETNVIDWATNFSLTLADVQLMSAGNYSVVVTNAAGSVTSSNAILAVFTVLPGSLTNYTFQSNMTYYVETTVQLYGVTTIEGGAVIKYAGQPAAQMTLNGPLVCLTGPGSNMAVLTSKDDDSVGVTEGSTGNPSNTNSGTYLSDESGQTNDYRFLRLAYAGTGISGSGTVNVRDSQFVQCGTAVDNSNGGTVTLMNNLFYCSAIANFATNLPSALALSNNLVFGTTVNLPQPPNTVWYAFNNDFDTCTITNSTLTNGYNAYLNCNGRLYPTNANDVVTNASLAYQTNWLGGFYQPPDSPLIHAGSTTADQVGLYHYTVTTNQVIEGTNIVSIGYHYVATDNNGNPLDSNSNGIPDYAEDANGNGIVDNGEANWALAILTQPQSQMAGQGCNTTFSVMAGGITPLSYQWYFNGTNPLVGATGATLMLTNVQFTNAGNYSVVVANAFGSATSSNAVLTVNWWLTEPPLSQDVVDGDTVTFRVDISGNVNLTYQWTSNDVAISSATNSSYTIDCVQYSDAGAYAVIISDGTNSLTSTNATLTTENSMGYPVDPYIIPIFSQRQDYTFKSGVTYYIWSPIQLYDNTTIEGGAVLKFDWNYNPTLQVMGSLTCKTEQYYPAILTSVDDDAAGDYVSWASDDYPQTAKNGLPYLDLSAMTNGSVGNLRVCFADEGIVTPSGRLDVWDCQFVACNTATVASQGATDSLHNVLFAGCGTAVGALTNFNEIDAEQVTADVTDFWEGPSAPVRINLTNSIILGTLGSGSTVSSQNVAPNPSYTDFQTLDYANYYLATNTYRQAGTANISPRLLAELRGKTTYPPVAFTPYTQISGDLTLLPQAPRYTNGAPDLGYYYPALDYTVANMILMGGSITVEPGTVIAVANEYVPAYDCFTVEGFDIREGSSFVSHGTPNKPNIFTAEKLVQETPETDFSWYEFYWSEGYWWWSFDAITFVPDFEPNDNNSPAPTLDFRFSKFYLPPHDFHIWSGFDVFDSYEISFDSSVYLSLQDCAVRGGQINLGAPDFDNYFPDNYVYAPGAVSWLNNSFDNVCINLSPTYYYGNQTVNCDMQVQAFNNLFRSEMWFRGAWFYLEPNPASAGNWTFKDNLFDKADFLQDTSQPLDYDYNGYWPMQPSELLWGWDSSQLLPSTGGNLSGAHEVVVSNAPPYQFGPFGKFYLPNTTPLYGAGSRSPGDAGLFQYTTQTNQVKEGDEPSGHMVNIGVHYVAATNSQPLGAPEPGEGGSTFNFQPLDTDGDGIPDYVEDANGNGVVDANETDWRTQYTTSGVWDPTNSVYDDIDLSGDGLVGRIKKALGMNPFDTSNPLTATQIITGGEPDIVTFEVPISYNVVTNIGNLYLLVDGNAAQFQECDPATDGNCLLKWNTTFDPPGQHYLAARLALHGMLSIGNSYGPDPTILDGSGTLTAFYSTNVCQFNPVYTEYDTNNGAFLYAQLPEPGATYTIELNTSSGEHIKTIIGSTSSGEINEHWDLTDDNGNIYTNGGDIDAVFNISLLDPTTGSHHLALHPQDPGYVSDGNFTIAYASDDGSLATTAIRDCIQWGVVDPLISPPEAGGGGSLDPYSSTFNDFTSPEDNGNPGYLSGINDVTALTNNLKQVATRNFHFDGHGNETSFGNNQKGAGEVNITAGDLEELLGNYPYGTALNGLKRGRPFRFVFLNACETADDDNLHNVFGIYHRLTTADLQKNSQNAQAYVGWVNSPRIPLTADDWYDFASTYAVLYDAWMAGIPLDDCLNMASQKYPFGSVYPITLNWPFGTKFLLPVSVDPSHPITGWARTPNNFYLKIYGYAGLERRGYDSDPRHDDSKFYQGN
jgi:alpha-tubulin suppressor-like RCC1 family protein/sugar lactone lactonase YvrE